LGDLRGVLAVLSSRLASTVKIACEFFFMVDYNVVEVVRHMAYYRNNERRDDVQDQTVRRSRRSLTGTQ
jgi:hypothetical protein